MADFYGKMKADKLKARIAAALGTGGVHPKYKVLQIDMMKPHEREMAAGVATFVHSEDEAYKLAEHEGFSYKRIDHHGRSGVICYHNIEISMLFRRLVIEREPGPADPVPERVLSAPGDEWIQIPLTNTDKVGELKGVSDRLRSVMIESERYRILWQDEVSKNKHLEFDLSKTKKEHQELVTLRERTALQEKQIASTEQELQRLQTEIKLEKIGRREDKINIMRELIPVFNTAWLAGLHRVGDKLYEMLKQQIVQCLKNVGVDLVSPEIGEGFNPQMHHAVHSYEYATGAQEIDKVVQVNRVGWKLSNGPLIEPADVAVGVERKGDSNAETSGQTATV